MKIYHVRVGDRQTTVSMSDTMAELLALHLGTKPGTPEAAKAVRKWLQKKLDEYRDPGRIRISGWLQDRVLEELVYKELSDKYTDWMLDE